MARAASSVVYLPAFGHFPAGTEKVARPGIGENFADFLRGEFRGLLAHEGGMVPHSRRDIRDGTVGKPPFERGVFVVTARAPFRCQQVPAF